jgi:hypothetical protein
MAVRPVRDYGNDWKNNVPTFKTILGRFLSLTGFTKFHRKKENFLMAAQVLVIILWSTDKLMEKNLLNLLEI